jgi:hypothetical protein
MNAHPDLTLTSFNDSTAISIVFDEVRNQLGLGLFRRQKQKRHIPTLAEHIAVLVICQQEIRIGSRGI